MLVRAVPALRESKGWVLRYRGVNKDNRPEARARAKQDGDSRCCRSPGHTHRTWCRCSTGANGILVPMPATRWSRSDFVRAGLVALCRTISASPSGPTVALDRSRWKVCAQKATHAAQIAILTRSPHRRAPAASEVRRGRDAPSRCRTTAGAKASRGGESPS